MALVPGGRFSMGSKPKWLRPFDRSQDSANEKPRREVAIKPFFLGTHEVTQAQWIAVMGANPSRNVGADLPVENVTWFDVQTFLERLNRKTGKRFRLPSEAEWEYAARGGTTTVYSFGNDASRLDAFGWFGDNAGLSSHPVGVKRPNPFGLYDMHGNVWEWVQDCWAETYDAAPRDGSAAAESAGCMRVFRGGGWDSSAAGSRSARRERGAPGDAREWLGFRLALTPP